MNGPRSKRTCRLRVLMSAYACEPERGSEPGVGWNWVQQIGRFEEVWVITRANNRQAIEDAPATQLLPNVHFIYFDLPRWSCFWKRGVRGIHAYYYLWQLGAYFVARKLHRKVGFDLVHHVTFVNYWMPSFLALLPVPFLWGPVGGGESAPRAFWKSFSLRGKVYESVRDIARKMAMLDPFVRLTARRAVVGFATTAETESRLRAVGCRQTCVLSQTALNEDEISRLHQLPPHTSDSFRVLSVGDLLHLKGYELSLKAFALFHDQFPRSEYWLIGDGPERKRLEKLVRELGIVDCVTFWGRMRRADVLEKLVHCDLFLHPTLHDSGGWASVEAMAAGRPVICLELGGPALQVNDECGIKVPAISSKQVVHDIAEGLSRLASDPALRARLAEAGRQRVEEHFNWNRKGSEMAGIYAAVMETSVTRRNVLLPQAQIVD
jgi:glycosyltransferase involved in cell wall biosynthesis